MKKQYQIQKRRAAEEFVHQPKSNPTSVQLTFSTAEMDNLAQHSLGDLLRTAGMFIETVMDRK